MLHQCFKKSLCHYLYIAMHKYLISLKLLVALSTNWFAQEAAAQNAAGFETISIAQGLSQGMVFDMLQDKEGFIWVATKNGLNRYDGYGFKVFTNDPYNAHTLSSNTIVKLYEDAKGRIWAGTENAGINIYDKKSGQFYRIAHNPANPASLSGNEIKAITEMPNGKILIASNVAGLNIIELNNNFFEKDVPPVITRLALPGNIEVYGMGKDKSNQVYVGGMNGAVYRFDAANNNFIPLPNTQLLNNGYFTKDESILINTNLFLYDGKNITPLFDTVIMPKGNIIFKPNSALWDNHHRELYYYDVSKLEPGKPLQWNLQLPATTRLVYPFIIDRSGVLWSGSVGYGLRKYNLARNQFKAQLSGQSIRFIVPVSANDIFLGDYGYGWRRIQNDSVNINPFKNIASVTQIDNFIIAKNGNYWIKSDNKGYFKYNPSSGKLIPYPQINYYQGHGDKQPMLEDSKGNLILPGLGGTFTRLKIATEKIDSFTINTNAAKPMQPKAICTALYEDKQGIFWIGTTEGFAKINFENASGNLTDIKWFYNSNTTRNSLNYNHVSCFLDDPAAPEKYLWIATKGGGLNRLDKTTGDFFHVTAKDGLPDDVVYTLLADDAGNIWGSTNKGIFCMSAAKHNTSNSWMFRNFTKASGLQDDEFNTGTYAKLPNGNLAFGGVNGLNIFNPKEILARGFKSDIFITNILVGNQPVLPNDKTGVLQQTIELAQSISLTHLQDILTLEFASLDFTAPNQNKYRYQLEGIDEGWVESGTRRTATYLHLPSGTYIFKVQGSNSQGIWTDKTAELKITVLPPWWRSWWAYLIYAVLIGLGIRAYFKFTVNRAKLKSQLNFEQLEAKRIKELDAVKTQLYTNITHEFRTPLTVILGMAQQVKNNPEKHLNNGINMIVRNGESLLNLVNEMLDLSKLEDGKMVLNLVNGDVINFLRYIVESFQSLALSQQKQFHFLSDTDELEVTYDAEKIRQIITNLLSNALKFTPPQGNVYISISQEVAEKNNCTVIILKVKDTGIGIPENQLQHIFDRFYQLDNSHTRKAEGTGIGLALTKELVKLMNGTIAVKSPAVGATKGTEFTITLPLQKATMENAAAAVVTKSETVNVNAVIKEETLIISNENTTPTTPLILLVEDNVDVVAYTASCLPDYKLAVGKDGKEGFEIATGTIPDLIITDVMMPFVDGFEMCRQLRSDERTSHIPIIMLTAKADMQSKLEGLDKGADVYLEKPFNKEELLLRIKKLLELRKKLQQYYSKQIGITNTAETLIKEDFEPIAAEKAEHEFVKKVREIVESNFTNYEFTVEQLCKLVFMSHSQLHRKLEALTGCSPNKFIRIIRLNKAKELLANPVLSIAGIALDCGYNDSGYFARVFKQEYGVTPQEWRVGK